MTNGFIPGSGGVPFPSPVDGVVHQTAIAYPTPGLPGRDGVDGKEGPPGPPGEPGPASGGPVTWHGQGTPPDFLPGSKPGDAWLDTLTGDIYTLE